MELDSRALLAALLRQLDQNRDGRITASDLKGPRGRDGFSLKLGPGLELRVQGAERLSLLATVLGAEAAKRKGRSRIDLERLVTGRVDAAIAAIAEGWSGLIRSAGGAEELILATREGSYPSPDGVAYLYVAASDPATIDRLRHETRGRRKVELVVIPKHRGPRHHRECALRPGIAYLPNPYLVPGDRFLEMYGWDSYFEALGALAADRLELALGMAENQLYALRHYGKIPNSNRSYHLSRSQPPFLAPLVAEVHAELERRDDPRANDFLRRGAEAVEAELLAVWGKPPRTTGLGLARYHDEAEGPVPEVAGAFFADKPQTPEYHRHDRALRESGWDLSHRFGRTAHLHAPVCLNALLYRAESLLASFWRKLEGGRGTRAATWSRRAAVRRERMDASMWDRRAGLYFDVDLVTGKRSRYETLATFYPLWAGSASKAQAEAVAAGAERFLFKGGLATSTLASRRTGGTERFQWDYPIGWAPLQLLAVKGLRRYGHGALADEIAYRWLWMVLRIFGQSNGLIKEKYDVVRRSTEVTAEYLNQGTDRGPYLDVSGPPTLGFGWTNASVPLLLHELPERLRRELDQGTPPIRIFGDR